MFFSGSSHEQRWLFSRPQLAEMRKQLNMKHVESVREAKRAHMATQPDGGGAPAPEAASPVTVEEELRLLRHYHSTVVDLCTQLNYPRKVKATALVYLKRLYLKTSLMDMGILKGMLTCIYLAGKIEEAYIGAEDFCRALSQEPAVVLKNEIPVLQALNFDLVVHSPYRALEGLLADVKDCLREGPSSGADEAMLQAPPELLDKVRAAALSAVDALLLSDAPLVHPPGLLALAALRSGWRKHKIKLTGYIERAAGRSREAYQQAEAGPSGQNHHQQLNPSHQGQGHIRRRRMQLTAQQLAAALDEVDVMGMEGAQKVDRKEVADIDRRILAWRNPMSDPKSDIYKAAASAAERERNEKREAKAKARREALAAEEDRLLRG